MSEAINGVFIAYQRGLNSILAHAIAQALQGHNIDSYMLLDDRQSEQETLNQIAACSHFLLILTPGALSAEQGDALRKQIMHALIHQCALIRVESPHFDPNDLARFRGDPLAVAIGKSPTVQVVYKAFDRTMASLFALLPTATVSRQPRRPPKLHLPMITLASALVAQDYFERAIKRPASEIKGKIADYTEAIRRFPQFVEAYVRRGGAYLASGNPEACIADCDAAIYYDPQFAEAYYNRGLAYSRQENYERAIANYTEAIHYNPRLARVYVNRGAAYTHLGDLQAAIADYSAAIELNPLLAEAYFNRSLAYSNTDNFEGAITDFAKAMGINMKSGVVSRPSPGDVATTVAYLEQLLRRWPDHPQAQIVQDEIDRLNALTQKKGRGRNKTSDSR
jgi:tetratricopeptide (TPR) repeat protein